MIQIRNECVTEEPVCQLKFNKSWIFPMCCYDSKLSNLITTFSSGIQQFSSGIPP